MISSQKIPGAVGEGLGWVLRNRILGPLVLAVCLLALPQGAWATSATWSGVTNFDYNALTNWVGPPVSIPGTTAAEIATFTNNGFGDVGVSAATANAVGLTFSNTADHDYTITVANGVHQGLTGVTTTGKGVVTLTGTGTGTYTLTGPCTFNIGDPDQNTNVSGVITNGTGAGSLTKAGSGTLILSGSNTYSGGTTLTAGTLGIGVDSVVAGGGIASGALGTGTLTVDSGALQAVGGDHTLANNIVNNTEFIANGAWNLTLNGVISGAGTLIEYIC